MARSSEAALAPWWWQAVGFGVGEQVLEGLLDRHREPHRHYHTAAHVEWVLRHVDTLAVATPLDDGAVVVTAAFFHDAVYEPTAAPGENERASAVLAVRELSALGWPSARTERVAAMIRATAGHEPPDNGDDDTAVLLDADLAVLAADAGAYDAYVNGVRSEYRHLDDETWRAGRSAVLRSFLERRQIFATPAGRQHWEARARANLTAELAGLHPPAD